MRYKVNDEVLIKARIKDMSYVDAMYVCELVTNPDVCIRFKSPTECIVADKTYADGLADAWKLADKVYEMRNQQRYDVFGTESLAKVMDLSPQEAIAKIEVYEREKEIKVGDEVKNITTGNTFWVIAISKENIHGYSSSAEFHDFPLQRFPKNFDVLVKTGRTTDAIELLKQIGE